MKLLAADVGTSSARIFLGEFDGEKLKVSERARFEHGPVYTPSGCYWDLLGVYERINQAVTDIASVERDIGGFTLDSWGTDMVALDRRGDMISMGVSTRDERFEGLKEEFFTLVPEHEIYARTGIQFLNWNSLYLCYALTRDKPWIREACDKMMFVPDCLMYLLTGERNCDYTIASTSQMLNPWKKDWDEKLVKAAGLSADMLYKPVLARRLGNLRGAGREIAAYSGCSHDTAAAVAGVPWDDKGSLYVILGSWAMMGTLTDAPVVNEAAEKYRFSNEGAIDGSIRFLKNSMGMWLVQESRRAWKRAGIDMSYARIAQEGAKARPWRSVIDVNDPRLQPAGDIPGVIRQLCREGGQPVPETVGEVVRTINDSLAVRFAVVKSQIEECTAERYDTIHAVAGGSQDKMLCQAIADATGCRVMAGPVEASAYGSAITALIASENVKDMAQAREILRKSVIADEYLPTKNEKALAAREASRERFKNSVG